jgi:hypothetical protein
MIKLTFYASGALAGNQAIGQSRFVFTKGISSGFTGNASMTHDR